MTKKEEKLKKFLLSVPEKTWDSWKDTVPRALSLNEAITKLLEEKIKNEK